MLLSQLPSDFIANKFKMAGKHRAVSWHCRGKYVWNVKERFEQENLSGGGQSFQLLEVESNIHFVANSCIWMIVEAVEPFQGGWVLSGRNYLGGRKASDIWVYPIAPKHSDPKDEPVWNGATWMTREDAEILEIPYA